MEKENPKQYEHITKTVSEIELNIEAIRAMMNQIEEDMEVSEDG
jgi:hypothetical protein